MKYYLVLAKCGHVGKGKYIERVFTIIANSEKMASDIVKVMPRVKKHLKNAITWVKEVSLEEFNEQKKINENDSYLHAHSSREIIDIKYGDEIKCLERKPLYKRTREFESRKERISYQTRKNQLTMNNYSRVNCMSY